VKADGCAAARFSQDTGPSAAPDRQLLQRLEAGRARPQLSGSPDRLIGLAAQRLHLHVGELEDLKPELTTGFGQVRVPVRERLGAIETFGLDD
jgi:hypothetical protein